MRAWAEPRDLPLRKSNSTTCGEIHKIVNALCRYVFVFHFVVSHLNYVKHLRDENADVALQTSVFIFKKTLETFITKLFCRKEKKTLVLLNSETVYVSGNSRNLSHQT